VRESRCGLALMTYGSLDGVDRLLGGTACAAAIHLPDATGVAAGDGAAGPAASARSAHAAGGAGAAAGSNVALARERLAHLDCVLLSWATREQGLVLARGNPQKIRSLADLRRKKIRVVVRQQGAGSQLLFLRLLADAGIDSNALHYVRDPAQTESEVASAILDGRADAGLAVRAVAQQFQLDFLPLTVESLDLAVLRASYFDAPMQALMGFTQRPAFARQAKTMAGYDVSALGTVRWNA